MIIRQIGKCLLGIFAGLMTFISIANDVIEEPQQFPFGVCLVEEAQYPNSQTDIMGFRLCFLYGRHANLSGFDIGVIGCGVDGCLLGLQVSSVLNNVGSSNGALQIAGIANNSYEDFYGFQLSGIVNNSEGSVFGGQISVFNLSKNIDGTQIGVYNKVESMNGFQIGVINWAHEMNGIQLGLLNIIEKSPCPYLPVINSYF